MDFLQQLNISVWMLYAYVAASCAFGIARWLSIPVADRLAKERNTRFEIREDICRDVKWAVTILFALQTIAMFFHICATSPILRGATVVVVIVLTAPVLLVMFFPFATARRFEHEAQAIEQREYLEELHRRRTAKQ